MRRTTRPARHRSPATITADDDDTWLQTLGLIKLFRAAVSPIVTMLREACQDPDFASVIATNELYRRGNLRGFIRYRVQGENVVAMLGRIRIEFNMVHPEGFSAYLLRRHLELNPKLARPYPQFVGLPVVKGLEQLEERGLIRAVDPTVLLFALTQAGLEKVAQMSGLGRGGSA
jgi:hypothetical protein